MQGQTYVRRRREKNNILYSPGATTSDKIFRVVCWLYLVSFFILPDGCGFYLGFLFSAKRICLFIAWGMILFSNRRLNLFWQDLKECVIPNIVVIAYMGVRLFVAVYRADINTFAGEFLDGVLVFYFFIYLLRHELTFEDVLKMVRITLIILCLEGIFEYVTRINVFAYLNWAGHERWGIVYVRSGSARITGNCHHSILYGLYIQMLFYISCIDLKKNRIFLFKSPLLLILSLVVVVLSGSRLPVGTFVLGIVLICLFSSKNERRISIIAILSLVSVLSLLVMLLFNTPFGKYVMYIVTATIDGVFGTTYSMAYGGTQTLVWSSQYRDLLWDVFKYDYLNPLIGRGVSYDLSNWVDGFLISSGDNSYVLTYVQLGYPGVVVLAGQALTFFVYTIRGLFQKNNVLFRAALVLLICYFIGIAYVAFMGIYMYIWMVYAMVYVMYTKNKKERTENGIRNYSR